MINANQLTTFLTLAFLGNSLRPIFVTLSILRSQRPEWHLLKYQSTPFSPMSLHEQFVSNYVKKAYKNGKRWAEHKAKKTLKLLDNWGEGAQIFSNRMATIFT